MNFKKTDPVKTVLTITVGFIVVYLITKLHWAIIVALIIGVIGVFSVFLSKKIDFLWMKLAWILSLIVPNILLGAFFFLFLFPISLLSKIFGKKDPLHLKNKANSVYKTNDKIFEKKSFENTW